jgi:hypothetical protein
MMGIIAAKPTIGSHFLIEEIFKFDCCLCRSIYYLLILLLRTALDLDGICMLNSDII